MQLSKILVEFNYSKADAWKNLFKTVKMLHENAEIVERAYEKNF